MQSDFIIFQALFPEINLLQGDTVPLIFGCPLFLCNNVIKPGPNYGILFASEFTNTIYMYMQNLSPYDGHLTLLFKISSYLIEIL